MRDADVHSARSGQARSFTGATLLPVLLLLVAVLALAPRAWAQSQDCSTLSDDGERLKCKHGKVIDQQERLVGNLKNDYADVLPSEQIDKVENSHKRSKRAADRMSAQHYKMMAKKHDLICETKELKGGGDGDGICEGNEDCEEVTGDQIGDDIQPCDRKGKHKEVCVQICHDGKSSASRTLPSRFDYIEAAVDEADPELVQDLESGFDDMADQLGELNDVLEDNAGSLSAVISDLQAASGAAEVCKYSADWQSVVIPILSAFKVGNAIARGLADVAERGCDQTAFGANSASLCALGEGIVGLINVAAEAFEGVVAGLQANLQDDTGACLEDLSSNLADVSASVVDPNGSLAEVRSDVGQIWFNTVDPNGDLAVIKSASLENSGNSHLMVTALNDHNQVLGLHNTALTVHDTTTKASFLAAAAALAAMQQEQKVAFEVNLEEMLVRPDACVPTLWLPAVHGGRLEVVRNHVAGTLQRVIASGDSTANVEGAAKQLAVADGFIQAGQYLKACRRLAQAVQALR